MDNIKKLVVIDDRVTPRKMVLFTGWRVFSNENTQISIDYDLITQLDFIVITNQVEPALQGIPKKFGPSETPATS